MTGATTTWEPDAFSTQFTQRADGALLLQPLQSLPQYHGRLMDSLEHWAQVEPQRILVAQREKDGAWRAVTYVEMLDRVQRVAAALIERDLSAERPIAILSGNSIEHLTLAFAAMWVGIPYCPVSPSYSQASSDLSKLRYVMELLTPGLIAAFDTPAFERALCTTAIDLEVIGDVNLSERPVITFAAFEATPSTLVTTAHKKTAPDTIAKFLLTSGSTGHPKAVITTNRMLCSNQAMLRQALPFVKEEPPILMDWLPWNHTFGGSHNVGLVLCNGGTLYIDDGKPTPAGILGTARNLREVSPTVYFNVPKGFEMLAHLLEADADLRQNFYRRLRAYFFAGASLAQHTWDALDAMSMQERGVGTPMLSGLGATETGPSVTFTTPAMGHSGVIGLPACGNTVKLAPVQEKLEIRVRSPSVTPGYWRQAALTEQAFDEEGFYRLGDAVRLVDADDPTAGLVFDGRIGEDFKLANGTWVSVGPLRADIIAILSPLAQDVVIAGLNADFVAALIVPDLNGCAQILGLNFTPTYSSIASDSRIVDWVRERLSLYAHKNPASTRCVRRALILPTAPSLDAGEVTDKGSINQRAVLRLRSECVTALYAPNAPSHVAEIGSQLRVKA